MGILQVATMAYRPFQQIKTGKYVSNIEVKDGTIKVVGTKSLKDLTITLEPTLSTTENRVSWKVSCESIDSGLKKHCADTFRF